MNAADLLRNRVAAIAAGTRDLRTATASLDWTKPIAPGTSPLGLTFWHLPRTFDWLVNTCIRDTAEVADGPSYGGLPDPDRYGFGTALTPDEVSAVAADVDRDQLETYADAVHAQVDEFLASLSDDDLDRIVVGFTDRQQRRPSYAKPGALAEVVHLDALPLGVLFARPGLSHQLMHVGELDLLKQLA
ncbi:MAG: DinB family protein [Frankiales bacterium]|nr:DinB family protein [Frankiales bacterium]